MLEGLRRLVRADAGVCVVSREATAPPDPAAVRRAVTVSMVHHGLTEEDAYALAARYPTRAGSSRLRPPDGAATHDAAESVLDVKGMKVQARVAVLRRHPGRRRFAAHDLVTLDLLHSELAWVYGPELPPLSPAGVPLSPRQRQTLQLLLAGNSEKEIGRELALSKNTVQHHGEGNPPGFRRIEPQRAAGAVGEEVTSGRSVRSYRWKVRGSPSHALRRALREEESAAGAELRILPFASHASCLSAPWCRVGARDPWAAGR